MYTNCEPQKLIQPHPEHLLLFQTTAAEFPSPWSSSFYFLPRFLPPFQCQLLERDLLIKGNQELEEMSYCLVLYYSPGTKGCLTYMWEVKLCPERPWKLKSWCNEGLAKPWPGFCPSCRGFPGSEPRNTGSKGKRKFHGCCPLGQLCRGAEDFHAISCTFSKNLFLTEACVLCQWHIAHLCARAEFLRIENERSFICLLPVVS